MRAHETDHFCFSKCAQRLRCGGYRSDWRCRTDFFARKVSPNGKHWPSPADPFSTGEDGVGKDAGGVERYGKCVEIK